MISPDIFTNMRCTNLILPIDASGTCSARCNVANEIAAKLGHAKPNKNDGEACLVAHDAKQQQECTGFRDVEELKKFWPETEWDSWL